MDLPIDRRLENLDPELIEICGEEFKQNIDLVYLHLRDARNLLPATKKNGRIFAKAAVVLASAALEANLAYLSHLTLRLAEARPRLYTSPQLDYLRRRRCAINDKGIVVDIPIKQSLQERLRLVPDLLARAFGRRYRLPAKSARFRKLQSTVQRRDAIIHPRWDRYADNVGWWEAAEAIDAVELYLDSISLSLHPYLTSYFLTLYTVPGFDKDELAVGHRTLGKRHRPLNFVSMTEVGIRRVLVKEWIEAFGLVKFAVESEFEGDSDGSMLTRAALVLIYAMLDAQLSIVAQWRLHDPDVKFEEAEVHFLNEYAIRVGLDGQVLFEEDRQSFKQRIVAVPRILSRRVERRDDPVELSKRWGSQLLDGHKLRDRVIHAPVGVPVPRVSMLELLTAANAVKNYFEELINKAPRVFAAYEVLLNGMNLPSEAEIRARIDSRHAQSNADAHKQP
jgi:hypothetical protein